MTHSLAILHLEDREDDALLFKRALAEQDKNVHIHWVSNVLDGKAYLLGEGKYADRQQFPFPDALVADLKLPGLSGYDFIEWLTEDSPYPTLPVLILTNSNLKQDAATAESMGINFFFEKPATFQSWRNCAAKLIKASRSLQKRQLQSSRPLTRSAQSAHALNVASSIYRGI